MWIGMHQSVREEQSGVSKGRTHMYSRRVWLYIEAMPPVPGRNIPMVHRVMCKHGADRNETMGMVLFKPGNSEIQFTL